MQRRWFYLGLPLWGSRWHHLGSSDAVYSCSHALILWASGCESHRSWVGILDLVEMCTIWWVAWCNFKKQQKKQAGERYSVHDNNDRVRPDRSTTTVPPTVCYRKGLAGSQYRSWFCREQQKRKPASPRVNN